MFPMNFQLTSPFFKLLDVIAYLDDMLSKKTDKTMIMYTNGIDTPLEKFRSSALSKAFWRVDKNYWRNIRDISNYLENFKT